MRRRTKRSLQFLARPLRPMLASTTYTMRSGPARGLKRRGGFMFVPTSPSPEEQFLSKLHFTGKVVYDVGANIGVMSLFFARAVGLGGRVLAIEPNPDTMPLLRENIRCNEFKQIQVFNVGLGETRREAELVVHRGRRGSGSMEESIAGRFLKEGNNTRYSVEVHDLDSFIRDNALPDPDFVKIDTEGMEYRCLRGMRQTLGTVKPELFIELHGASREEKERSKKAVLDLLWSFDYQVQAVEDNIPITARNWRDLKGGHIYCF